ncbi:hypothetical protein [Enterococcus faecalis]|uniref:Uncharacterized protein n=1 Tax=Enterococcus faecalis RP2S-4 TaxID=1244145 RepID=A0ABC9TPT8_ENTFL|nr:hypothetical protein [Enterococcus faecalis]EPI11392.1 hypothetical protein D358_00339 [Enterococcus faecalis RP2S-4]
MNMEINKKIVEAKKEVDRLIDKRSENLGGSINYIINESNILKLEAQIEAYEEALEIISKD